MEVFEINASLREVQGKGASRRLRRAGLVPAVLYGGSDDPVNLQLEHNDLFHHAQHEAFYSHILNLIVDGKTQRVVLRDMQRHPFKPSIMHIDLQRINENEAITMRAPLHFINEEQCVGVKTGGGIVSHLLTELEISCLPKDLPEYIEVDVIDLDVGDSLHLSDLKVPEGVQIAALMHGGDPAQSVVAVQAPRVEVVETDAPEAPDADDDEGTPSDEAGDGE
ncbi:MAG: 50S ribosomal protein L25/general stress protein Ctc [Gammaproteobacteria bacterium]